MGAPPDLAPASGSSSPTAGDDLRTLAGAVAHDLRTPLAALAIEVELALCRERTAQEYRDALGQIGERANEALDILRDLAMLASPGVRRDTGAISLDLLFDLVSRECASLAGGVQFVTGAPGTAVRGDEAGIGRALTLLLRHAVRGRTAGASVRLRAGEPAGTDIRRLELVLEAVPSGFRAATWQPLHRPDGTLHPGWLPLRVASKLLQESGATVAVLEDRGGGSLSIGLACA